MGCFSLGFWEHVCIIIVVVIGLWSIIKLFLPYLTAQLPPLVVAIIRIVIWVCIAVLCIIIIFTLISCIFGMVGGLGGPSPFHLQR